MGTSNRFENIGGTQGSRHISPLLRLALLLGVLVHLAGFFFFRVISNPLPTRAEESAYITLISKETEGGKAELIEQASLFDSAPLFIPGEWSTASGVFSSRTVQDMHMQVFPDYEPEIELLDEVRPVRMSLPRVAALERPSDLLDLRFWDLFAYFGEKEIQIEAPDPWTSVAVITVLSGGGDYPEQSEVLLEIETGLEEFGQRPVAIVLNMTAPGLPIGAPVLKQSSGSEVLDSEVLGWLGRPGTLAKLPAGLLEIRVFP